MSDEISSSTRAWTITTLVLSGLYLPMTAYGLYQLPHSPINATGQGSILLVDTIAQLAVALAFFIGSIALLRGVAWGRNLMMHASAAAIVTIVVGVALQFMIKDNPAYLKATVDQLAQRYPQGSKVTTEQLTDIATLSLRFAFYAGMVMAVIQAAYCILLYRHMSSVPATTPAR